MVINEQDHDGLLFSNRKSLEIYGNVGKIMSIPIVISCPQFQTNWDQILEFFLDFLSQKSWTWTWKFTLGKLVLQKREEVSNSKDDDFLETWCIKIKFKNSTCSVNSWRYFCLFILYRNVAINLVNDATAIAFHICQRYKKEHSYRQNNKWNNTTNWKTPLLNSSRSGRTL